MRLPPDLAHRLSLRRSIAVLAAALAIGASIAASAVAQSGNPAPPDSQDFAERALACTGCHGDQGVSTPAGFFPRIAGKPSQYLFNQLRHFQTGNRSFPAMDSLVRHLPPAYLAEFADYFAALELPYAPPLAQPQSERARQRALDLVLRGDPALGVPACQDCHGQRLTGVEPAVPGLLGLPRDYLNAQLGAWRLGTRRADMPDCMHDIVARLPDDDLSALTAWLAGQPVPGHGKPAAQFPNGLPTMRCGSFEARVPAPDAVASLGRGEYLARIGNCAACHSRPGGRDFAGGVAIATPFGTVYGSNLTPDPDTGIGRWSSDDFWRAMSEGRRPDGSLLNPVFPFQFFAGLTRADSDAIYQWLRSIDPVSQPNRAHDLRFPFGEQMALRVWRWLYFSSSGAERQAGEPTGDDPQADTLARGRYLFDTLAHCQACHGERNFLGGFARDDRSGGAQLPGRSGYAPSLSDRSAAGVADWSLPQIEQFLASGHTTQAGSQGLMALVIQRSTQYLTANDRRALAQWLLTISDAMPRAESSADRILAVQSAAGRTIYEQHCADCHGDDGQGQVGRYPSLVGRRAVLLDNATNPIQMVLYGGFGPATAEHSRPWGMPGFAHRLTDNDIARVLNYIRSAWGNRASAVRADSVQQQR